MPSATPLRSLALAGLHRDLGARFAPFAGWAMPLQYSGIINEHKAVRSRAGVFDVSHMGRLYVTGPGAASALRSVLTYKVDQLAPGEAHYALLCDEDGSILDDLFAYRLEDERFLVVNNAANADVGRERIEAILGSDAALDDRQTTTVMLALQGPDARDILAGVLGSREVLDIKPRRCGEFSYDGSTLFAARTGYTGEDGFELVLPNEPALKLLRQLADAGVTPCGLGARDTLRLEAALPLYGADIDATTTPWEAGLGFAVTLDDGAEFAGRAALTASKEAGLDRKLACLKATGRGIMRAGCPVLHGGQTRASMSSGGFSPMLGISIGMAYLQTGLADVGTELEVDVRGKHLNATVVPRPFYRRKKAT
ncbi:MAG: glycine cleavage system aminomethyltransferase GcvT [Chloroflexi bacterium]|nr:glycine cleavage system aminomethyltransferase GcvT [Chloroflexota bacterium]